MPKKLRILLVHHQEEPWDGLTPLLEWQGITTFRARNCAEAERALGSSESHLLVLTEPVLPDGTWAEILALARRMPSPVPVVVVSRYMDVDLYLDVLEKGAWDFIVPPFHAADLAYVVNGAILSIPQARLVSPVDETDAENYIC
jgi:two-component system NtrC family response regulator